MVLAAVVVALTGCGRQVGPLATTPRPTTSVVPRGQLQQSLSDILPTPGVYDLCEDQQAEDAGLDGGDLAGERARLGVTCTSDHPNRYVVIDNQGVMGPTTDPVSPEPAPAVDLGFLIHDQDALISTGSVARSGVVTSSLALTGPQITGLWRNTTSGPVDDVDLTATTARGDTIGDYGVPFAVQAGESVPFAIPAPTTTVLDNVTIGAVSEPTADIDGRAILFEDSPGFSIATQTDLARLSIPVPESVSSAAGPIHIFDTSLTLGVVDDPAAAQRLLHGLTNVVVEVAYINSNEQVVGLRAVKVPSTATPDVYLPGIVGDFEVVLPPTATDVALWGYGQVVN